jgi:hypothetical protein
MLTTHLNLTTLNSNKIRTSNAMKAYWGSGGIAPRILDLGTRKKSVVSFPTRPLYVLGKSPDTH